MRNKLRMLRIGGVPIEDETGTVWRPYEILGCCVTNAETAGTTLVDGRQLTPVAHVHTQWVCGRAEAGVLSRIRVVRQGSPLIGERIRSHILAQL